MSALPGNHGTPRGQSMPPISAPQSVNAGQAHVDRLKRLPRGPGEASFFFYESHFGSAAVKVLPGEYFVATEDVLIMTTLGSCIAVCLWDRHARVGGLNHFMLPDVGSDGDASGGRYGSFAMELLINSMLKHGASRRSMEAKVFGGGQIIQGMRSMHVGERNTTFAFDYLATERVPVVSKDVLDVCARKVCFLPVSGKAMIKRLAPTNPDALIATEQRAMRPPASHAGSVDLF